MAGLQQRQELETQARSDKSNKNKTNDNNCITKMKDNLTDKYSFQVLYNKRSSQLKRSKKNKASRMDGILTVSPPPSSLVTLTHQSSKYDDDDDDDDDDIKSESNGDTDETLEEEEENLKKISKKRRTQIIRKRMINSRKKSNKKSLKTSSYNRKVVYSAINAKIAKQVTDRGGSLVEDDIVTLPQWECHIVSLASIYSLPTTVNSTINSKLSPSFPSKLLQNNNISSILKKNEFNYFEPKSKDTLTVQERIYSSDITAFLRFTCFTSP